ncbi:uncharacterized protein LOC106875701 [Octopus bimaculoides]|uniref:uncharacterized protein LOC106875701 n=1 Tax=Octopus bimaculoides TaxID=37653 RepID=UPI00071CF521|nr:uncharacterized protein LOC106875701 [Octopus bimaculoides]|eukprot:XP_014779433.1 PREDICTED: uncharacterized protein LOC106875701 [Octopus bimaculoides]
MLKPLPEVAVLTCHDLYICIKWTLMNELEDLDYADDLALLSHRLQDKQDKVDHLRETSRQVGLRISLEKTKVLHINNKQEEPITTEGAPVEDVSEFVYLISKSGGSDEDITARSKKAWQAFAILRPVWKSTAISTRTKLRLVQTQNLCFCMALKHESHLQQL